MPLKWRLKELREFTELHSKLQFSVYLVQREQSTLKTFDDPVRLSDLNDLQGIVPKGSFERMPLFQESWTHWAPRSVWLMRFNPARLS